MGMVTIGLFDVSQGEHTPRLSHTIEIINELPLAQRWRGDIRLDEIAERTVEGSRVYMLDFAKRRDIGPGRLTQGRAIQPIAMSREEAFGEETAAMYVPRRKWLLLLQNQAGIGPNRLMGYFNAVDPGNAQLDYSAEPRLDAEAVAKLERMRHVSTVEVTATLDALNGASRQLGRPLAEAARPSGAQRISFTLMANVPYKRGRFLDVGPIRGLLQGLRAETGGEVDERSPVSRLRVKGEDPDGDRDMVVDLIKHRVRRRYREEELEIVDRRFTIESRWRLLERTFRAWNESH